MLWANTKVPAKDVTVDASGFNKNLSPADVNVQHMASTINQLNLGTVSLNTTTVTSNYSMTTANDIVLANTTSSSFTVTLPTAVGVTKLFMIKRIGTGTNNLNIATTGGQTIDGSTTVTLTLPNTSLTLSSDNSNWRIQ